MQRLIMQPNDLNTITNGNTDWGNVPGDLIHLLVSKIGSFTAFIRFSCVCQFWQSIASGSASKFYRHVPWLMLSEKEETDFREFYDLSTNEVYQLFLPEAKGKKILSSAYGWLLIVGKDGQFNLLNPMNRMQINLPPQSSFETEITYAEKLNPRNLRDLFSVRATLAPNPSTSDFDVMVIHLDNNALGLSLYRPSYNGWAKIEAHDIDEGMLDFSYGYFYTVNMDGKIFRGKNIETLSEMEFVADLECYDPDWSYYAAECGGEIFIVSRCRLFQSDIAAGEFFEGQKHYTYSFKVYKLHLKEKKLTEIKSLGDYTLFVGFNRTICLPVTYETKGYKKNCIYFTDDFHGGIFPYEEDIGGLDMGIFNLDDGCFERHYPLESKSNFSMPIWYIPQFS